MNINILNEYHFPNLSRDDLNNLIDFNELQELPEHPDTNNALELLSQFLVGNVSGTFKEIRSMEASDQHRLLHTWAKVIKEPRALQSIIISIAQELL